MNKLRAQADFARQEPKFQNSSDYFSLSISKHACTKELKMDKNHSIKEQKTQLHVT